MEVGEISPIVATHYGFHLFKITDRKDPEPIPREEIEGLEERLVTDRRAESIDNYIQSLKEKGSIEEVEGEPA